MGEDEPNRPVIHMYMEMSQRNSLCSYLNTQKCHLFFYYKIGAQEGKTGPVGSGGELVPVGGEKRWGNGMGMNMVQILCTHVCKWKSESVETLLGMGGGDKGEWSGGEFNYDIFDIL
jgi:hypothetical protein